MKQTFPYDVRAALSNIRILQGWFFLVISAIFFW